MMFWQLFVVFYCGPGHAHVYLSYLCAGASQMKEHTGSCGQCRTVHEGFKPQSPCFLYGINKNYACTGQGERGHNFALLIPPTARGGGSHAAWCYAAPWSGKGFLPTGNQQLLLVFFLDKNSCDLPKARGDHTLQSSEHTFNSRTL